MRRTRAAYHYSIRQVRKDEDRIVRDRFSEALLNDPNRNFWQEVRKIRNNKVPVSKVVDGYTDEHEISALFANKYKELYTSVPFCQAELDRISTEIDAGLSLDNCSSCFFVSCAEVHDAINKLNPHKCDGNFELNSNHFTYAGLDLSVHVAFIFTCLLCHGSVPQALLTSTIVPVPKKVNASVMLSDNFRGIALSSVFGKIFDNILLCKYCAKLSTSDLQFGFKANSSTHMCSMVLKETISYYINHKTSAFCCFLHIFGCQ